MNIRLACRMLVLMAGVMLTGVSWAANPNAGLRIEVIAAPNFVVDSNVGTPASKSPRSAFVGARFWNDGTTVMSNAVVSIGDYKNGVGSTPGIYPSRVNPTPVTGTYSLTHEGGTAGLSDSVRYLGNINPGEYVMVYWLLSYPLMDHTGTTPVFGSGPDPADDLWLNYDIWGTVKSGAAEITAAQTTRATMRNEISAMANKIFPNTANQVPDEYKEALNFYAPAWTNVASDGSVGTALAAEGIWYQLGNVGQGYDCDHDLIPDHDAWLQPVGDPSLFDIGSYRLVKTHTLLIVKLKTGGEKVIMAEDQLYFKDIPENTAVLGYVRYDFVPLKADSSSQLTPYQEAASGSENEKFNGDYGVTLGSIPKPPPPSADLTKSTTVTNTVPGGTIPYTVTYTNSGTVSMGNAEQGVPLVVQEQIPLGTRYVQNSASISNVLASGVSGYTIFYSTNNAVSWQTQEPAAYTNVTHIQWWLNDSLPSGASGIVRFSVTADNPYRSAPLVVNTAGLSIGSGVPFKTATATTRISGNNSLGDLVWNDDGAGGGLIGNLVRDGTEAGLSNITVNLYYDSNTNGVLDGVDLFIGATTSATNGAYLFTNLVDGAYLVIVDAADVDLPRGYTLTTPGKYNVSLDAARTNPNPVSVLTADFGFAPSLSMTKQLTSVGPAYEGRPVNYSITVTNTLPGDGIGGGTPVVYDVWVSGTDLSQTDAGWSTPANANGRPDGLVSANLFATALTDELVVTNFNLGVTSGAITNVTLVLPIQIVSPLKAGNEFEVALLTQAGTVFFAKTYAAELLTTQTLTIDVTTNRVWSWTDFNSSAVQVRFNAKKQGGAPGGNLGVDTVGFRVTSTATYGGSATTTTLNPVPVVDTFDTRLLQFRSSTPLASSVTTNGNTGTITWNNVGPIYPGGSKTLSLNFTGLEPFNNTSTIVTNTASITNAFFTGGSRANDAFSQAITNLEPTGVIGDYVWRDLDRNGQTNSGDYGIANVKVVLRPPANVDAGAGLGVPITNVTDSTGYYLFSGLISTGRYVVAVLPSSLPNGGVNVTNTWTEMSGTSNPTNVTVVTNLFPIATNGTDKHLSADFGYDWDFSIIDGTVWNDLNRSGTPTRDSGEFGLTNVTVYLVATNNPTVAIATNKTNSTGYFSFIGNYSGGYYVVVTTNTGPLSGGTTWEQTYDSDGLQTTNRVTVTASPNTTARADFSYFQTGPYAIGDMLFFDWNNNGLIDPSDEGIPNIPLALYRDTNTNGVVDIGLDILLATTNTTVNGYYVFTNYPAGHYIVAVYQTATNFPVGYSLTVDPYGAKDGFSFLTITNSSNWNQDFGYQPFGLASIGDTVYRDLNADGVQSGLQETGITNVLVTLFVDLNQDGTYVQLASTNTLADGQYLFSDLPDGNYKVVVDAMSAGIPKDSFNLRHVPTTSTNVLVSIVGSTSVLTADFGFGALGAIGDTIFMDSNANGTQDWNEQGITNVFVNLYIDSNSNGVYEVQELYGTKVTTTNGAYLFTALPAGSYIVVVDTNSPALAGMRLTAAPALDGQPLASTNDPAQYVQYPVIIQPGTSFMGADFGFQPPGVIGETVWIDTNGNGIRDSSELGLVDVALVLSNAMITVTNRTDVDGYYNFSSLADGTYWVRVLTNSVKFTGLVPTYDPDGTNTANMATSIVISNGLVNSVGGIAKTNFNFNINFGYQYSGNNSLSGTVGLDGSPTNGVMGIGISGVSADEKAFANETVYLYMWRDADTNGVMDAGETTQLATTQTDANGDYQFTGLPSSLGAGTNRYVVALSAPRDHLILTTATGNTPSLSVVPTTNSFGEIISAYQIVAIATTITNIDFAFRDAWQYDFGDLPSSYSTLMSDTPEGASHRVLSTPNLYLGAGLSSEQDGQPSVTASLDSLDDGVTISNFWQNTDSGGTVQVTVGEGTGWLVGYIDFNQNGSFLDAGEMIVSENVSTNGGNGAGVYTYAVDVPANAIQASSMTTLYSRFRLLPSEPPFPELAFSGLASSGEVEDYRWDLGSVGERVWIDANGNGSFEEGEPPLENVKVFVDVNTNGVWDASEPYAMTGTNGLYGIGGFPAGTFTITVDTNTLPTGLVQTFDPDSVKDSQTSLTLAAGEVLKTANFGYAYLGAISGSVLIDVNGNGVAESGDTNVLSGVTIELLTNNVVFATTVTAANGGYSFTNLVPGAYTVREIDLSGWYSTLDVSAPNNNLIPVNLTSGENSVGNDFYDSMYGELGDFVWEDLNGDGVQDAGEPGMTNVTVRLLDSGSNVLFTTVTDLNGAYSFTNLEASTYLIQVVPPAQYILTLPNTSATNDVFDSDMEASGFTVPFELLSGVTDLSWDAGLTLPARIYGHAFLDLNTNLVRTVMVDYPIASMTVTLWRAGVQIASSLTAADGSGQYAFNNLIAGDYTVRFAGDTNQLEAVPVIAPATTDPERNRAAVDGLSTISISVTVIPGEGVMTTTEPRNAGFIRPERTLSEAVSIRAYASADGVRVEFTTAGEAGYGMITLWVWLDGAWVGLGSTPSMGFGSNTYSFNTPGLEAGKAYYFKVEDEVGYLYDLYDVTVQPFAMEMQLMERAGVRLTWNSIPGRTYKVYTTTRLGDAWTFVETVWADSEYASLEVTSNPQDRQRFFKIVMVRDEVIE